MMFNIDAKCACCGKPGGARLYRKYNGAGDRLYPTIPEVWICTSCRDGFYERAAKAHL